MNNPKFKTLFLLVVLSLVSCVSQNYHGNFWYRSDKASTYFEKKIKPIDSIKVTRITVCKKDKEVANRFKTKGELKISLTNIEESIISELKNNFKVIEYKFKNDTISNFNCSYLNRKNILSGNYMRHLKSTDGYTSQITVDIKTESGKDYGVSGFYSGRAEVLDKDAHVLEFTLRLALFDGNKLIYMDNYSHYKKIISDFDKNVYYEVPKTVVDTLITNSLSKYRQLLK
jgi:hypothetical protein